MAVHQQVAQKLNSLNVAYTQSGATASVTGNLNHRQLDDLIDACWATDHAVKVIAGVVTIVPGKNS